MGKMNRFSESKLIRSKGVAIAGATGAVSPEQKKKKGYFTPRLIETRGGEAHDGGIIIVI